jgi:hypothetical protein
VSLFTEGTGSSATFSANRPTRWYLVSVLAADAAGHRARTFKSIPVNNVPPLRTCHRGALL